MDTIGATEAKQHFGELLDRVQRNPVAITKQGRPVAMMLSVHDHHMLDVITQAIEDAYWGQRANKTIEDGYMGTDASAQLINDIIKNSNS